jgi:hypothetical protein
MTHITLAIGGVLLGVRLLITIALAVKALQNRLGRSAGAADGLGRRIRVWERPAYADSRGPLHSW